MGKAKAKAKARADAAAAKGKERPQPKTKASKAELARQQKQQERMTRAEMARKRKAKNKKQWASNFQKFQMQLKPVGLMIRDVAADGNCMFRAVCDQMTGVSTGHGVMRQRCVDFMIANREDFEWFIEDDVPFDTAMMTMRRDSEWGGHLELVAMSKLLTVNVVVHQLGSPPWEIRHFPASARCIHLSYHDLQHYASVRAIDDDTSEPAKAINLAERAGKAGGTAASDFTIGDPPSPEERMIMSSTLVANLALIRKVLGDMGGDVDATIEYLIAGGGEEEDDGPEATGAGEAAPVTMWRCGECTLQNPSTVAACAVCGTPGGVPEPACAPVAAPAPHEGSSGPPPAVCRAADPTCPICTLVNEIGVEECVVCGAPLPDNIVATASALAPAAAPAAAPKPPGGGTAKPKPNPKARKIKRNDPCPCGSGLRFKSCCHKKAVAHAKPVAAPAVVDTSGLSNKERKELARKEKEEAEAAAGGKRRRRRGGAKERDRAAAAAESSDSDGGIEYTSVLI